MASQTSLEKILAYYNTRPFLKDEDWVELGKKFEIGQNDLKRVTGKTLEDYFFVMVRCYERVESTIVFSEALSKLTDTPSPDGLILFKDGKKVLVEVKSTAEPTWTYSRNRIQRQKEFADKLGMDLLFAIFINGYWGVYNFDFLKSRNFKIEIKRDLRFSLFDSLFDPKLVKIPKGLKIIKRYSSKETAESPTGVFDPGYGHQINYKIVFGNIWQQFDAPMPAMAFTAVEASILLPYEVEQINDEVKEVTHECKSDCFLYDYRFVLDPIQITTSDTNKKSFNTSSFIAQGVDIGKIDFTIVKDNGLSLIEYLQRQGFPFEIVRASETDYLDVC